MSTLHLGCTPWQMPVGSDAGGLIRQAQLAEALGYESFWLPESHFGGEGSIPDPLMLLATVAGATTRIRLATTSYLLPLRHPIQAAEQVAVLDRLSGGRVMLGVGRGFAPALFEAYNLPRNEKRELFADCLQAMRAAWAGEPVASGGTQLAPLPVQQPHPPIWVAAFGPKALAQAGSLGLPYLASPLESLAALEENLAIHRGACQAAGVPVPPEVPLMRTVFVSENAAERTTFRALLEAQMAEFRRQREVVRKVPDTVDDWAIVGTRAEVEDRIAQLRERTRMTHLIAARLHIGTLPAAMFEESLAALAALLGK